MVSLSYSLFLLLLQNTLKFYVRDSATLCYYSLSSDAVVSSVVVHRSRLLSSAIALNSPPLSPIASARIYSD